MFLVISTNAKSQIVDYFANDPQWRQMSECGNSMHPCLKTENFIYYVNGDTIIDSVTYVKIYKRGDFEEWEDVNPSPISNCPTSYSTFNSLETFMRQDGRKIFWKGESGISPESLLYDFGLNKGDTINFRHADGIISSVDSLIIGSDYRRIIYFHLDGRIDSSWIVEGIGNKNGFMEPFDPLECIYIFYCFRLNDTVAYSADSTNIYTYNCNFNVSLIEAETINIVGSVSPNPTVGIFEVEVNQPIHLANVSIFNIVGKKFKPTVEEIDAKHFRLDISTFPTGIYYVNIEDTDSSNLVFKVLKE